MLVFARMIVSLCLICIRGAGISELRRVGDLASAAGVEFSPHCPWGPVALTASVHAMAAVRSCTIHEMAFGTPQCDSSQLVSELALTA